MIHHPVYDALVFGSIVLGSALLLFHPLPDLRWITVLERLLTGFYCMDVVLKLTVMGLFKKGYKVSVMAAMGSKRAELKRNKGFFDSAWNAIDLAVVAGSVGYSLGPTLGLSSTIMGFFFVLRGGRPLRLISRVQSCRELIMALAHSLGAIRDVIIVILAFIFMAAITGMQLFKGTFWSCSDPAFPAGARFTDVSQEFPSGCPSRENAPFHYDDIGNAVLSTTTVVLLEGWGDIAMMGMDSVAPEFQPSMNNSAGFMLYFFGVRPARGKELWTRRGSLSDVR